MGIDHYSRVLISLLVMALLGAGLIIVMLLTMLWTAPQPTPLPIIQVGATAPPVGATATPEPRLLENNPPQTGPRFHVVLVDSQMSKTITAQKIIAITTPVILEPVYGPE